MSGVGAWRRISRVEWLGAMMFGLLVGTGCGEVEMIDNEVTLATWKQLATDCASGSNSLEDLVADYFHKLDSQKLSPPNFVRTDPIILDRCSADGSGLLDMGDLDALIAKDKCDSTSIGVCRCDKIMHIIKERQSACNHAAGFLIENEYRTFSGRQGEIIGSYEVNSNWCNEYRHGHAGWLDVYEGKNGGLIGLGNVRRDCEAYDEIQEATMAVVTIMEANSVAVRGAAVVSSMRLSVVEIVEGDRIPAEISLDLYCSDFRACPTGVGTELLIATACAEGVCRPLVEGCFAELHDSTGELAPSLRECYIQADEFFYRDI